MTKSKFIPDAARLPVSAVLEPADKQRVTKLAAGDALIEKLLAGVISNSPYLSGLLLAFPDQIDVLKRHGPEGALALVMENLPDELGQKPGEFRQQLRLVKRQFHLCLALIDLAGVWGTDRVAQEFSSFADRMIARCLAFAWQQYVAMRAGKSKPVPESLPEYGGFFIVAFGKLGGCELNYSSDVDLAFFFDPEHAEHDEKAPSAQDYVRLGRDVASLLSDVSEHGYGFRVDLRLRPDPSSTPISLSTHAALGYYESVGQTWERAAWIKARIIGGNQTAGMEFLEQMRPFIWRQNLDFAAIEDIHQIRKQILFGANQPRSPAPGFNVKLGVGGIREVELFVQTLQLIHGGRNSKLRLQHTLDTLSKLASEGLIAPSTETALSNDYLFLRRVEHALQMVDDRQTHEIPTSQSGPTEYLGLLGYTDFVAFQSDLQICTSEVSELTQSLFHGVPVQEISGELDLSGMENHPDTVRKLEDIGFKNPAEVVERLRNWMAGRVRATRTERARRLLVQLAPELVDALAKNADPDIAFVGFTKFFEALPAGVQVLSLFANCPGLMTRLLDILVLAPRMAEILSSRPHVLEILIVSTDRWSSDKITDQSELRKKIKQASDMEAAMDVARRASQEEFFFIGSKLLGGQADPALVASGYTSLADAAIAGLSTKVALELSASSGSADAQWAVLGLGKLGAREMMPNSDLDLILVYTEPRDGADSTAQSRPEVWASRFTRRLISALSAPTSQGSLYEVDMQLRPSGRAGPIAIELSALKSYYQQDALTWELQALTRARIVCASSQTFADDASASMQFILNQPRDRAKIQADIAAMRLRLNQEKPALGEWDLKAGSGGLVELEFILQSIRLVAPGLTLPSSFFDHDLMGFDERIHSLISEKEQGELSQTHNFFHRILQITGLAIGRIGSAQQIPARLQDVLLDGTKMNCIDEMEALIVARRQHVSMVLDQIVLIHADGK